MARNTSIDLIDAPYLFAENEKLIDELTAFIESESDPESMTPLYARHFLSDALLYMREVRRSLALYIGTYSRNQ